MEYKYSQKTLRKKHRDNYTLKRKMFPQLANIKNIFEAYTVSLDEYFYYAEEQIGRLEFQITKLKNKIAELEAKNDDK